jgi:hypothetical protein
MCNMTLASSNCKHSYLDMNDRWFATSGSDMALPGAQAQVPSAVASLWENSQADVTSMPGNGMGLSGEWATWKAGVTTMPEGQASSVPHAAPPAPQPHQAVALQDPAIAAASPATPPRPTVPVSPSTPLTPNSQIARLLNINQQTPINKPTQPPLVGEVKLPTPVAPMRPNNSLLNKLLSGGISGTRYVICFSQRVISSKDSTGHTHVCSDPRQTRVEHSLQTARANPAILWIWLC